MVANPADAVVSNATLKAYEKARNRLWVANPAEVNTTDLSAQFGGIFVLSLGADFNLDSADHTTADDGATVLVDNAGTRFKITGFARTTNNLSDLADKAAARVNLGLWTSVVKTADETRTGTAVLANDGALLFAMLASTKYAFRARMFFDTTAAADLKARHTGPASPTLVRIARRAIAPAATADANIAIDTAYSAGDIAITGAGTNGGLLQLDGIIHNGVNAGNFALQWAQNTSDVGNTIVRAGSYIDWRAL